MGTDQGVVYTTPGSGNITEENTVDESDVAVVFASTDAMNTNYLRLAAGSPAVNVGNNLYLNNGTPGNLSDDITTDVAGETRIQNGTVDLGAYESDLKVAQIIAFSSGDLGTVGTEIELMATASSTLPVTFAITGEFKADGTTPATAGSVATLGGAVLTPTGIGTVVVTASQVGNEVYEAGSGCAADDYHTACGSGHFSGNHGRCRQPQWQQLGVCHDLASSPCSGCCAWRSGLDSGGHLQASCRRQGCLFQRPRRRVGLWGFCG